MNNEEEIERKGKEIQERVKTNPQDFEAHFLLGNNLRDLGRHDEAEREFRRAVEIKPDLL